MRQLLHPPALLALIALLGACGGRTQDQRIADDLSATCTAQVGASYAAAASALQGGYAVGPLCSATLLPMSDADACGAASAGKEVCQVLYYWFSADPGACQGGTCVCELRLQKAALDAQQGSAPICAARFLKGQPSP